MSFQHFELFAIFKTDQIIGEYRPPDRNRWFGPFRICRDRFHPCRAQGLIDFFNERRKFMGRHSVPRDVRRDDLSGIAKQHRPVLVIEHL